MDNFEKIRYAGFVEEKEYNEAPQEHSEFHVDIASSSLDVPTEPQIVYEGGLGKTASVHRPGMYQPQGNVVYAADVHTIGWMIKWALGGYKFEAGEAEAFNKHFMYASENVYLPSFATAVGKDLMEHVFSGCMINTLELEVDGEFVQVTADIMASKDHRKTLKAVAELTLPDAYPLVFHEVTAHMDGSDISPRVNSMTLTIENNLNEDSGRGLGSRFSNRMASGERTINVSASMKYDDLSMLEKFWGGSDGPTKEGSDEFAMEFHFDGGNYGDMNIKLPRLIFTEVPQQPSGRDDIEQSISARAFLETGVMVGGTEASTPIVVELANDKDEMKTEEEGGEEGTEE